MKLHRPHLIMLFGATITLLTPALGQLTIDCTGPTHKRAREATSGRGGSASRSIPLKVAAEMRGSSPDANGKTVIAFKLTNNGSRGLVIPTSPSPGDVEPADATASYAVKLLALYVTADTGPKGARRSTLLSGGCDLYGKEESPSTLATLAPGASVEVLMLIDPPPPPANRPNQIVFVAHAWMYNQTMKALGSGRFFADNREVGSASSADYSPSILFKTTDRRN